MNKLLKLLAVVLIAGVSSFAAPLNITVFDGEGEGTGWYGTNEDNEVTNKNSMDQKFDLEAVLLDGTNLSIVGGRYNFLPFVEGGNAGDIFIDITGDAVYGKPMSGSVGDGTVVKNSGGWDYAIDIDYTKLTYEVYSINDQADVRTVDHPTNAAANPWLYVSGGTLITSGVLGYAGDLPDNLDLGYTDEIEHLHNQATVDVSFLGNTDFTVHYTMQCGNDLIIGKGSVNVPEPTVASLFGISLLGVTLFLRKRVV